MIDEDGIATPWRCRAPWDAKAVQDCLGRDDLTIVAEKHIMAYSAWLWQDEQGNAFLSKQPSAGRGCCWAANATAEFVLRRNPSLKRVGEPNLPRQFTV